jgi:hypothetical protein
MGGFYISGSENRTHVVALQEANSLPDLPPGGLRSHRISKRFQ